MSVISATRRQARLVGDRHQAFGQVARHRLGIAEGARAAFHVHHQPVEPLGHLLRQDRAHDQRDELDRGRDVARGVEPPVGRRQIVGLADHGAADLAHDLAESRDVGLRLVARDRRELVERAAGMAEPAAGDHRHEGAAGGHDRRQHQAHLVADAAARMLVDHRARQRQALPFEGHAGVASGRASAPPARPSSCRGRTPPWRRPRPGPRSGCRRGCHGHTKAISSADSSWPSRFLRMISCGSMSQRSARAGIPSSWRPRRWRCGSRAPRPAFPWHPNCRPT